MGKPTPCPDCGQLLSRHQRKSHEALYCSAKGAPGLTAKKCANKARDCERTFLLDPKHPQRRYCSRQCNMETSAQIEAQRRRDAKACLPPPEDEVATQEESEREAEKLAAQMAAFRRREEWLRAELARTDVLVLAANETNTARWLALLEVPHG